MIVQLPCKACITDDYRVVQKSSFVFELSRALDLGSISPDGTCVTELGRNFFLLDPVHI